MEILHSITEVAKTQENYLTKKEIKQYFGDMELAEAQWEHVYQYLGENKISVEGFAYKPMRTEATSKAQEEENIYDVEPQEAGEQEPKALQLETKGNTKEEAFTEEDSAYLKMYLEDLSYMQPITEEERQHLFLAFRNGESGARERIMESYLLIVVELAKTYQNKGVYLEDLIQEGNIGLLQGIESLAQISRLAESDAFLRESIKGAMESMLDEEMDEADWESTVLAKTNLISEAAKYLAEDLGRVATRKELAEYTKMTEEEIQDVLQLSIDAVKVR